MNSQQTIRYTTGYTENIIIHNSRLDYDITMINKIIFVLNY
jgi:hypothetical protein